MPALTETGSLLPELGERVERASRLAERDGRPAWAAATAPVPALDVSAAIAAARRETERWFCLEQPERDGFALAALGSAAEVRAQGGGRFEAARLAAADIRERLVAGEPQELAGAGPVLVGGFAFAPAGGATPEWSGFGPVDLILPELALVRRGDEARITLCVRVEPGADLEALAAAVSDELRRLTPAEMPLLDPHPTERPRVAGATPPSHFEEAVAQAVERIRAGEIEKIVLAREVRVHAPRELDPGPVFDGLRAAFPACLCFLAGGPDGTFVGASPELLVRRDGARAQTVALAGTTRRSADPAVDDHLGEQLMLSAKDREEHLIVARRIERTLAPHSVWVAAADEPGLVKVQNVQHLATPIRAQLREPLSALELAGILHPTPAVGGEPGRAAVPLIPALEAMDRGWYAGGVGWTDFTGDGEFCVALRCALLSERIAHLYAGCGIVRDSDPAAELAESEVKLQALLPLLA